MINTEMRQRVNHLLASGLSKQEIFTQLLAAGANKRKLANYLARCVSPLRRANTRRDVVSLAGFLVLVYFVGILLSWWLNDQRDLFAELIICPLYLLLVSGFWRYKIWAWEITLVILGTNVLLSLWEQTIPQMALGLLIYTAWLRKRVFPDLRGITPRMQQGQHVWCD